MVAGKDFSGNIFGLLLQTSVVLFETALGAFYYALSIFALFSIVFQLPLAVLKKRYVIWKAARRMKQRWEPPPLERRSLTTRDGVMLNYYILPGRTSKTIVFAHGLGVQARQPSLGCWGPIVYHLGDEFTYITWDYRGLFNSEQPSRRRRLAIHEHAEDLIEILNQERVDCVHMLCGFSMGVQVSLETAVLYPERLSRLLLVNGTHGQVFTSALQPFFRVPFCQTFFKAFIGFLARYPNMTKSYVQLIRFLIPPALSVYSLMFGSLYGMERFGADYLGTFLVAYFGDVVYNPQHTQNYLRLFQELDAHSVYHHLGDIEHPTLVISGLLDTLTPAYMSFEIASEMPHARHVVCPFASHAALLEQPGRCIRALQEFMLDTDRRYRRSSSTHFLTLDEPEAEENTKRTAAVEVSLGPEKEDPGKEKKK